MGNGVRGRSSDLKWGSISKGRKGEVRRDVRPGKATRGR